MGQFFDLFVRFSHVFFVSNCCNASPKDVQETLDELCRTKTSNNVFQASNDAKEIDLQEEPLSQSVQESPSSSSIRLEKEEILSEDEMYDIELN
jgi:low affinity Fe/Cu permease